jgi:anti-sigma factor RsiW
MNSDDKKPEMENSISPELETRIVAWVAGEASAFEAAELERLIQEKPELAVFKRRIAAVQGLVAEAVRPERRHSGSRPSAGRSCSKKSVPQEVPHPRQTPKFQSTFPLLP